MKESLHQRTLSSVKNYINKGNHITGTAPAASAVFTIDIYYQKKEANTAGYGEDH